MQGSTGKHQILFGFLSLFIIYHLATILILPNASSVLGRSFAPYLTFYANTFGLNTTWIFFSPDPSPKVYLEYEVLFQDEDEYDELKIYRWPPEQDKSFIMENYNRMVYNSRFISMRENSLQKFFVPWVCRQFNKPLKVVIRTVAEEVESIEKARLLGKKFSSITKTKESSSIDFFCPGQGGLE